MDFSVDTKTTALILIDLQRMVVGYDLAPYSGAEVLAKSAALAAAFREKGGTVVYVRVDLADFYHFPADKPSRDPSAAPPPAELMEFAPECGIQDRDLVVTKKHWGAFASTDLASELRERGVNTVVVGGVATNFGVESTVREAAGFGFAPIVAEDACSTLDAAAHRFACELIFPRLGRVRSTAELIAAML